MVRYSKDCNRKTRSISGELFLLFRRRRGGGSFTFYETSREITRKVVCDAKTCTNRGIKAELRSPGAPKEKPAGCFCSSFDPRYEPCYARFSWSDK